MKVKTKVKQEISDCYVMATHLEKLNCAVNTAYKEGVRGDGRALKYQLTHVVQDAYELGMLYPRVKALADTLAKELRAIQRHTKDKLPSADSRGRITLRLANVQSHVGNLKLWIKERCHVTPPFQGSHPAD
jgi:hypothetical protein